MAAVATRAAPLAAPCAGAALEVRDERLPLPGGRAVQLRALGLQDAAGLQAFVVGLSPDARHKRFHIGLRELGPKLLRQLVETDPCEHVAWAVQELPREASSAAPRLVAEARYVREADRPDQAEFALAVADDWQSLGLGRTLIARLTEHARRNGIRALFGDVLVDNRRMIVLMLGLGAQARPHPDGPQLVRLVFELSVGTTAR